MKKLFVALLTTLLLTTPVLADNTSNGTGALGSLTTGFDNVAIGNWALTGLTTGYNNIALGPYAGSGITTGFNNIVIGFMAGDALTTEDGQLYIMHRGAHSTNGIFGDFAAGTFSVVGDWSVSGASTVTGAQTFTGAATFGGNIISTGDTLLISQEAIVANATEGADSSAITLGFVTEGGSGDPKISFADSLGGAGNMVYSGDRLYFQLASGGYWFDQRLTGHSLSLGRSVAGASITTVDTNEDLTIDPNGDGTVLLVGQINTIQAITADNTLTAAMSGDIIRVTGNTEVTLPTAVAGYTFTFITVGADSCIVVASASDVIDIIGDADNASINAVGTAGESITLVSIDGTTWEVISSLGTWAGP